MPDYFLKLYDKDYAAVLEERVVCFNDDTDAAKWCRANSTHGERWEYSRECHSVVGAAYRQTITDQYMKKGMI